MTRLGTYAYLNARLRARLGNLLSAAQYERLAKASDIEAVYEAMRHTDYADAVRGAATAQDLRHVESALLDHLISCHREVAGYAKGSARSLLRELMRKYEMENLKVILRAWYSKVDEDRQFIYRHYVCNDIPIDSILEAETIEEIIVLLADTPYQRPLREGREKFKKTGSLFHLEVALDRELYEATWAAIEQLPSADRKIASRLIGIEIDILNINWVFRLTKYYKLSLPEIAAVMIPHGLEIKRQLLADLYPGIDRASLVTSLLTGPYSSIARIIVREEETQALQQLEGLLREIFVQQIRRVLGGFPFTIGVAISYLRLKNMEVSNIITLLNARALSVPVEEVQTKLIRL